EGGELIRVGARRRRHGDAVRPVNVEGDPHRDAAAGGFPDRADDGVFDAGRKREIVDRDLERGARFAKEGREQRGDLARLLSAVGQRARRDHWASDFAGWTWGTAIGAGASPASRRASTS